MTKTQYRKARANWTAALADGRVVRYNEGQSMTAFPDHDKMNAWLATAKANGIKAEIVTA